ncbi:MAG TPA: YceI family protein [Pseudomonadales bacterium]
MPRLVGPLALTLILLGACQAPPPAPAPGPAAAARVPWEVYENVDPAEGRVYRLIAERSSIHVHVYRAGALAERGHNHVIGAGALEGAVLVPTRGRDGARFDLVVPVGELEVDEAEVRRALGHTFGSAVDDEARAGTRANMLGPRVLDGERFPFVAVSSRELVGELPKLVITAALTVRDVTREQRVPVDVRLTGDELVAEGAFAIRQSDFGIEPFSALGGLLRVEDTLTIEFRLVARSE